MKGTDSMDLDLIEKLEQAATPGPWEADTRDETDCVLWSKAVPRDEGHAGYVGSVGDGGWTDPPRPGLETAAFDLQAEDCRLIAALRNAAPDMIAEIRALRARVAHLEKMASALVYEIYELASESEGVAGLHPNGEVAEWDDLLPAGKFERLSSLYSLEELVVYGQG